MKAKEIASYNGFPIYTLIADVKKSNLFKALAKHVREEDHEELARMLSFVAPPAKSWKGLAGTNLTYAFGWHSTPQGHTYWQLLRDSIQLATEG